MAWYSVLFNIDVIAIIIIALITIYLLWTRKKSTSKKKFSLTAAYGGDDALFQKPEKKKAKKKLYKTEERCREIFQSIFKREFKSIRPKWLKNPATGRNLELDGYCEDIGMMTKLGSRSLAFEVDGVQHAQYTPYFHKTGPQEFVYQDRKDAYKSQVCKQRKILLIRIPHIVLYEDLDRYIRDILRLEGLLVGGVGGSYHATSMYD